MSTLTQFLAAVRARGNFHAADTQLTDTVLTAHVNTALRQIAAERDWPWMESSATITTTAGVATIALPAVYSRTKSLTHADSGQPITLRSIEELDRIVFNGRPYLYAIYGTNINVKPIPDNGPSNYSLVHRFYVPETTLVAGADTPLIPTNFDEGVIEYATYLAYKSTREADKARDSLTAYALWLRRTSNEVKRTRAPLRIQLRPGALT